MLKNEKYYRYNRAMKIPRAVAVWQGLLMVWLAVGSARAGATTADPPELKKVQTMTVWRMSHPDLSELGAPAGGPAWYKPDFVCGIRDPKQYEVVRLDHEVDDNLTNTAATREIKALDQKVLELLLERKWKAVKLDPRTDEAGIPNLRRCYRKNGLIAQIYETTARCTMNTPCTAYDGFTVVFYIPKNGDGAAI